MNAGDCGEGEKRGEDVGALCGTRDDVSGPELIVSVQVGRSYH
jgi:hypothetical protein